MRKLSQIMLFTLIALVAAACSENSAVESTNAAGPFETVSLAVENMTCATCPIAVRKALEWVEGVQSAKVDFETKTATVAYNPKVASVAKLTAATTDAGYPSKRRQ